MKRSYHQLLHRCQFPLLIATGSMPIVLCVFAICLRGVTPSAWLLPGVYTALAILGMCIPKKGRWIYGAGALALLMALGSLVIRGALGRNTALCYGFVLLMGLPLADSAWYDELPSALYWAGLAVHAIGYTFVLLVRYLGSPLLEPAVPGMSAAFLIYVLLVLLALNRESLSRACAYRHRPPLSVRRRNLFLLLVFFLLVWIIAATPAIASALHSIFQWISAMLQKLSVPPEETAPVTTDPVTEPIAEDIRDILDQIPVPKGPSAFALWLQNIVLAVAPVLPYLLTAFLAISVVTTVLSLLKKIGGLFRSWGQTSSEYEDYEEEITDAREPRTFQRPQRKRRRKVFVDERKLPPAARIRYRYSKLLKKHPEWAASSTARENLPKYAAPLYEQARYSDRPLTEEDASQFAKHSRRL